MDDLGQVSAEMIVLLAAVLAIAYIVISSMGKTASDVSKGLGTTRKNVGKEIDNVNKLVKNV